MTPSCPLCKSNSAHLLEVVKTSDLVELYRMSFGNSIVQEFSGLDKLSYYHCRDCELRYFFPTVTGTQDFYQFFQKFEWYYMDEKEEYALAGNFIKENARVLEIGCGKGAFSKFIKTENYTGIEFSAGAKKLAEQKGLRILNESIEHHAVNNRQKYDVVCSFQVLEHVSDVNGFIRAAIECLDRNGLFIISVPNMDSFIGLAPNLTTNLPPHHVTHWSEKSLRSMISLFGIDLVEFCYESLADFHVAWYNQIIWQHRLNSIFFRRQRLIDKSRIGVDLSAISRKMAKYFPAHQKKKIKGHSVLAVYKKRNT